MERELVTAGLDALLAPRRVAVIGASDGPGNVGGHVVRNLLLGGYPHEVVPVSRSSSVVAGLDAVPSVADLPDGVDLAVVAVGSANVVSVVEQCADRGVRACLVLTSGFSEMGNEGAQVALEELVRDRGLRICGPNCAGFMNQDDAVNAHFMSISEAAPLPDPGPLAIISQSGGFGSFLLRRVMAEGLGVSWLGSTGNEVDVNVSSVLRYVVERPSVRVALCFAETIRDGAAFIELAQRAAELDKPLIVVKTGRSEVSERAALSHTASIAGAARTFDQVCRQFDVHCVESVDEMIDLAKIFANGRRARGPGVAILTNSGGTGAHAADAVAFAGLEVPELGPDDQRRIAEYLPENFLGSLRNPVDVSTQAAAVDNPNLRLLEAMASSAAVDMLMPIVFHYAPYMVDGTRDAFLATDEPMAVVSTGAIPGFAADAIPVYLDAMRAGRALGALRLQSDRYQALDHETSATEPAALPVSVTAAVAAAGVRPFLLEADSNRVLQAFGVPVAEFTVASTPEEASAAAAALGFPVAVKAMSYQLPHKSDFGALRLGLATEDDVRVASDEMLGDLAQLPDVEVAALLVQRMVKGRLELSCGINRDLTFGPMVTVGLGGVAVELFDEIAMLAPPFDLHAARRAIASLLEGRLVGDGRRALSSSERDGLAAVLVALGQLALAVPEIESLDVNPLIVADGAVTAADALLVLR